MSFKTMRIATSASTKRLQNIATELAKKSPCNTKHGALITFGHNKVCASGYNNNQRTKFLNRHDCCMHAEMAAVNSFINSRVRRNPKRYCF